jgi:hypothetical protein
MVPQNAVLATIVYRLNGDQMQELVPLGKSQRFRDINSIMKVDHERARLSALIDEAIKAKKEIAKQQEIIKGARSIAAEELKLNPKLFNAYLSAAFNNDYTSKLDALGQQVDLLTTLLNAMGGLMIPTEDNED